LNYESLPEGVRLAIEAARDKKAANINVLDLRSAGAFTDHFVICTGFSAPQVQAICTGIEEILEKNLHLSPEHREGRRSAEWALLDFGRFVVHVFGERARHYYDLERLWRSVPKLEIPDEPGTFPAAGNSRFERGSFSGEIDSLNSLQGNSRP
jgi:ribosome-associated protein